MREIRRTRDGFEGLGSTLSKAVPGWIRNDRGAESTLKTDGDENTEDGIGDNPGVVDDWRQLREEY